MATGSGQYIAAFIGYATDEAGARAAYEKVFGDFEMTFSFEGVVRNAITVQLFAETQLARIERNEGVANVEAYARSYVNLS